MPADIRSFFGGKPASAPADAPKPTEPKKRGRARKVVEDDDDDEVEVVSSRKSTPKKKKQAKPEPALEETSAGDFFGNGNKPKRSEAVRPAATGRTSTTSTPKKANGSKKTTPNPTPNGRTSTRAKKETNYIDLDDDDFPDDFEDDAAQDNFRADASVGRKLGDDYEEGSADEDDLPLKPQQRKNRKPKVDDDFDPHDDDVEMKDANEDDDFVLPDDDEEIGKSTSKTTKAKAGSKRKSSALEDEDEDDLEIEEAKPAKKRAAQPKKAAPKKEKDKPEDSAEAKAIFDSIPLIKAPSPPPKDGDDSKPKFKFGQHKNSEDPAGAISSSEIPQGESNCLAGLTFVFTGQLQSLGRERGQELVKQYGGKVTTAPSSKTSYVVLGEDAGPKKLETIKKNNLKVIDEEGLFALISKLPANGGSSAAAEKQAEKIAKEEEQVRKAAAELDKEEKERKRAAAAKLKASSGGNASASTSQQSQSQSKAAASAPDSSLWTVRHAPARLDQICGNKTPVEKLQKWLRNFPKNLKKNFKLGGEDGSGIYRAVMIHGPPGIGKTTAAHLVAKLEGYDIVESNASDTRSKKLVETSLKGVLSTTSLMGYFAAGSDAVEASKKKLVLIMDEVDGMSAGDRGGVGALAAVARKTQVPMILICNERRLPKMKPFDFITYDLAFRRPTVDQVRSRIMTIAYREGLKMPANVINALIEGSNADIRQVVNMISTAKLDTAVMTFDGTKDMTKAWEKHLVLKPWDMVNRIMAPGLWNPASKSTLNEKQEIYFNDHDMAPLMLQENYLGSTPQRANKYNGMKKRKLADLELISCAADAISDGDLVDRMIHGSQQQWSLMPVHAMFSFVRPASFMNGSLAGSKTAFASWLGRNSNMNKLIRYSKEIQSHMRLRVSADRHEIRQTYMPLLFDRLVRRLQDQGKDSVPEIIDLMDYYYLTREDWDAILELGVGDCDMQHIKIEPQAKSSFTRIYNQQQHPMPFMKASSVMAPKKAPAKERPDLEEAFEESDEGEAVDEADVKDEEDDLLKDKYVKQPKKRKAAGTGAKAGGSKKRKTGSDDDASDAPKAGKATKGKGKGRAKK